MDYRNIIKLFIPFAVSCLIVITIIINTLPGILFLTKIYFNQGIQNNPKVLAYRNALFDIPAQTDFYLFGAGPGMYASSAAIKTATPLAVKYVFGVMN